MRLTKFSKKLIAYLCAIAMVVTSFAFTPSQDVNAATSETIDGITYTVTDGAQGDWTGIVTQGIFDKARIHWAWGKAVQADSIAITVDGKEVTALGANANGVHVTVASVKDAVNSELGDYVIKITAVSTNDEQLMWTADLKMEEAGPTTTRDPSVINWVDIPNSDGLQYDDRTNAKVINVQQPGWPGLTKPGVYVEPPSSAGAPITVTIDGVPFSVVQGDNGPFYVQGAGILYYVDTFVNPETTIVVDYAAYGEDTLVIKNTKASPTTEAPTTVEPTTVAPTEEPTEAPTTEAPTGETEEPTTVAPTEESTEAPTTEEPTTEEPTTKNHNPQDYYDAWVDTDRNLAPLGTANESNHKEGTLAQLNDKEIGLWTNYEGVHVSTEGHSNGYVGITLNKAYDAASIDQVVLYWRTADGNFYPANGYTVQFGYKGVFTTVDTFASSEYPTEGTVATWTDDGRFVTDTDFTSNRVESSPVDEIRIYMDSAANYGAQIREMCVFSENPQDAPALPKADDVASVSASSPDYGKVSYSFVAGEGQDDYTYNAYMGTTLIGENVLPDKEYTVSGIDPGTYEVRVISLAPAHDPSDGVLSELFTVKDPIELFSSYYNFAPLGTITAVTSFYDDRYDLDTAQVAIDKTPEAGEGPTQCLRTGADLAATIDIDLGKQYKVSDLKKIVLAYTNFRTYAANTEIGISSDGETYVQAANTTGYYCKTDGQLDTNLIENEIKDSDETFRYVRINLSGGANNYGYVVNQIGIIIEDGTEPTTTPEPTTEEPTTVEPTTAAPAENWKEIPNGSGDPVGDNFFYDTDSVSENLVVNNVQKKNEKVVVHVWNKKAAFKTITINGQSSASELEGAGAFVLVAELGKNINLIELTDVNGDNYSVRIKNDNLPPETTTEGPTEEPTTGPSSDNLLEGAVYEGYIGSDWAYISGTITQSGDVVTANITRAGGGWADGIWGGQIKSPVVTVEAGQKYIYTATLTSTKDKVIRVKVAGKDNSEISFETITLTAGEEYNYSVEFDSPDDVAQIVYALGAASEEENPDLAFILTVKDQVLKKIEAPTTVAPTTEEPTTTAPEPTTKAPETTTAAPEPTTIAPEPTTIAPEPTTVAPETSTGPDEPTTIAPEPTSTGPDEPTTIAPEPTTKAPVVTTKAPTPTTKKKVKAPGKTKVKKAIKKKKSPKKIKVTLKKVKGAKGYQIAIYKSKKNAKKNKKAIKKKYFKKAKFTVKSKKFKKYKKLYARARAYALDGKKKVFGKWSKIKKVKNKK